MTWSRHQFGAVTRYIYGILTIVVVAAAAVVFLISETQFADREARDRVAFFNLQSIELAGALQDQSGSLRYALSVDPSARAAAANASTRAVQVGPGARGILQMMSTRVEQLLGLQDRFGGDEFVATLGRVERRLASVQEKFAAERGAAQMAAAIGTLELAVEQLRRQHVIAADQTRAEVDRLSGRLPLLLVTSGVILLITGMLVWLAMRLMQGSISRRVAAEEALAESQERMYHLQRQEALGRLVGGIAHDFNNLLTAILGQTELLIDKADRDGPMRSGLTQIRQAGDQAASLTRQLLTFSQPQPTASVCIDVNELIGELDSMLQRVIGEDIELSIRYADHLDVVELDPSQLQQIILNLAINARDAMPNGGKLSIATESLMVERIESGTDDLSPGRYTSLTVADTGCGMDKATCERIFEPYFTTKPMGRGTGLGLSTVHGIVTAAGGHVRVSTRPGDGTRFEILLPSCVSEVASVAEPTAQSECCAGSETVLVVEDEAQIRAFLEEGLETLGYRVFSASGAEEGLEFCQGNHGDIDVIVSDVIMPQKNGADFMQQAQRLQPFATSIFISGYTDDVLNNSGIESTRTTLLQKPFDVSTLARLIRARLDEGKAA